MSNTSTIESRKARLLAFYLPQYYPIPENDQWWGKGFTEWTNVSKAKALFPGHKQPQLPGDLGFYDLRVPEVRLQQAALATAAGIEGFCYWHYWFSGRRILERVFQEVLETHLPNFPFCLAWANESWSGTWHGCPNRILISQEYGGTEDYLAHFRSLELAFHDPRYLAVDGKPIFVVYKPEMLPNSLEFTDCWRREAQRSGLRGLYLVGNSSAFPDWTPTEHGFDAQLPHSPSVLVRLARQASLRSQFLWRTQRAVHVVSRMPLLFPFLELERGISDAFWRRRENHPCVVPNWDNTPRCGRRGFVLTGSTPGLFRSQLRKAIRGVAARRWEERLIFIKSWNEWAEGNYLEPDRAWGSSYLDVVQREIVEPSLQLGHQLAPQASVEVA